MQALSSPDMTRAMLIAILLILPYQFAWAAVSIYCNHHDSGHDSGQSDSHFGHHEHDHALALGDEPEAPSTEMDSGLGTDHDHYGSSLGLHAAMSVTSTPRSSSFLLISLSTPHNFATAEPERPNWTPAA